MKRTLTLCIIAVLACALLVFFAYLYHVDTMKDAPVLTAADMQQLGIDGIREHYRVPGFSYAVIRHGTVVKAGASGWTYQGSKQAVTPEHLFQIGSCTKAFTALIAARLVDNGSLRWDTPFFSLYPEWKQDASPAYADITLQDLLSHNAGVQPFTRNVREAELPLPSATPLERRLAFCRYVLSLPPIVPDEDPYSNAGYSLAAIMLEAVTGQSWEDLAMQTAAELGITIGFGRPNAYDSAQPWGHRIGWFRQLQPVPPEDYHIPFIIAPAGDVHMSVKDMATYIQVYLDGLQGKDGYLQADTCQYLLFGIPQYSLGWIHRYDGETYAFHNGSDGTFNAQVMLWKELDAAVILLTNAPDCQDTAHFLDDMRNYLKIHYIYR